MSNDPGMSASWYTRSGVGKRYVLMNAVCEGQI